MYGESKKEKEIKNIFLVQCTLRLSSMRGMHCIVEAMIADEL